MYDHYPVRSAFIISELSWIFCYCYSDCIPGSLLSNYAKLNRGSGNSALKHKNPNFQRGFVILEEAANTYKVTGVQRVTGCFSNDPEIKKINDEKKASMVDQFVAEATLRAVPAAEIQAIVGPLEAGWKRDCTWHKT
ncbi:unnamed protein product [Lactuca saligna]|uniref:Uncharacterized protein n=1 Tax=Lactuca saligna TaxID=75948 RepID=A0AA35VVJ1_LACSI|nr:unnamed protein product [Lactuca saligna]